jgi:hypothetical protein
MYVHNADFIVAITWSVLESNALRRNRCGGYPRFPYSMNFQ